MLVSIKEDQTISKYSIIIVAAAVWVSSVHAWGQDPAAPGGGWSLDIRNVCGDGTVEEGEECDDGNTGAGDGCSSICTLEAGYACIGEASACGPDCNDNDLPDECDLDCAAIDGACDVSGCGLSENCNFDGRPDECGVIDDCLWDLRTPPAALNSNAGSDTGYDGSPQLTTDGAGNWVAVWWSSEDLGGIGTDDDILFTTFSIP